MRSRCRQPEIRVAVASVPQQRMPLPLAWALWAGGVALSVAIVRALG